MVASANRDPWPRLAARAGAPERSLPTSEERIPPSVDWLVIADECRLMHARLDAAFPPHAAAVVKLAARHWSSKQRVVRALVDWAVREHHLHGVVLAMHTPTAGRVQSSADSPGSSAEECHVLASRIYEAQRCVTARKAIVAQQVEEILQLSSLRRRLMERDLQVHGLVYVAESDLFLAYDRFGKLFHPLMNEECSA